MPEAEIVNRILILCIENLQIQYSYMFLTKP